MFSPSIEFSNSKDYEIEFQSNFMREHTSAIQTALAKHMKFLEIQPNAQQGTTWKQIITEELEDTSMVIWNIAFEDNLVTLLDLVCKNASKLIATELILSAVSLLKEYKKVSTRDLNSSELLGVADKWAKVTGVETYDRLVKVFAGTVLLVLGDYFENPFVEDSDVKRAFDWNFDDEDDSQFRLPSKRRKYSF